MVLHTQVRVAVIREEGSNGDREMSAAVYAAGMEPWDITMSDLINGRAQLDSFRGIIFVGESIWPCGLRLCGEGIRQLPLLIMPRLCCVVRKQEQKGFAEPPLQQQNPFTGTNW